MSLKINFASGSVRSTPYFPTSAKGRNWYLSVLSLISNFLISLVSFNPNWIWREVVTVLVITSPIGRDSWNAGRVDIGKGRQPAGASIEFEGVPISFTRAPFLVTFDVDKVTKPFGAIAPVWFFGPALGVIKSGRYRNNHTRVEFDIPSDWTVEGTHPSVDNGDVVILKLASTPTAVAD
jgi:hypothetical protein